MPEVFSVQRRQLSSPQPVDFRKAINGLALIVEREMQLSPLVEQ